jgi:uncharacterized short protein YbdD (DUF466 family)
MMLALRWDQAREFCGRAAQIVRRIVGVPDSDTYLRHARQVHPDAVPLTREAYERECQEARYSRPGSRCC